MFSVFRKRTWDEVVPEAMVGRDYFTAPYRYYLGTTATKPISFIFLTSVAIFGDIPDSGTVDGSVEWFRKVQCG